MCRASKLGLQAGMSPGTWEPYNGGQPPCRAPLPPPMTY
jgi:hypothetical protein